MTSGMFERAIVFGALVFLVAAGQSVEASQMPAGNAERTREIAANVTSDPLYLGKPLSYWLKSIRNRDEHMDLAFDAIQHLGPNAAAAIPELNAILAAPFSPIEVGVDPSDVVIARLRDIHLHSKAVDGLAAIGYAAAPSAKLLADWALTTRVSLTNIRNSSEKDVFIDIIGIDVLERMRVAGAISQMDPLPATLVANLLNSGDEEAQKLAVAILSEQALPIATALLKSRSCKNQKLGMKILVDMWPVVTKDHLLDLQDILSCSAEPESR